MKIMSQGDSLIANAPAKLNLYLEILGKRADGFHQLETVMTAVRLYDTLRFSTTATDQLRFQCEWSAGVVAIARTELPQDETNLALRALMLLREHVGSSRGADVWLTKRIPAEAGMGGASSDAAAALLLGNRAWNLGLSETELRSLAAQLGSDVPFFLQPSPAICHGRGEGVTPIDEPVGRHYVIVKPTVGLSTAEVFRHCEVPSSPSSYADSDRRRFNRLEEAAMKLMPELTNLKADLGRVAVGVPQMTGSGTACFGWCDSRHQAIRAARMLRQWGWSQVFVVGADIGCIRNNKIAQLDRE